MNLIKVMVMFKNALRNTKLKQHLILTTTYQCI